MYSEFPGTRAEPAYKYPAGIVGEQVDRPGFEPGTSRSLARAANRALFQAELPARINVHNNVSGLKRLSSTLALNAALKAWAY